MAELRCFAVGGEVDEIPSSISLKKCGRVEKQLALGKPRRRRAATSLPPFVTVSAFVGKRALQPTKVGVTRVFLATLCLAPVDAYRAASAMTSSL